MFLKCIEIRGFKSFANKTELNFKEGITAIVGPNGSGKSNISDAIRWVLGEQSIKSLRGGKMEDVIFAGTQFRKPVGLAQVSLTLDNSDSGIPIDYSDVTISRRIYRSGESEYYINNTQCRLKDIQELFMDTGIGKEGYSIIGQGKIDAILSGKPEERRSLLEEAAGIVKFKKRKEEAGKKLQNTEENLIRIQDILSTYEERLEPLRIESDKANKFLELSNELKGKEINLVVHSIEEINMNIEDLFTKINALKVNVQKLDRDRNEVKYLVSKLNNDLEKIELNISNKKRNFYNKKEECSIINNKINILEEKINSANQFIESAIKELQNLKLKSNELTENKSNDELELKKYSKELSTLSDIVINLENQIKDISNLTEGQAKQLKKLKEEQIQYLSSISSCKNDIVLIQNHMENTISKMDDIKNTYEGSVNSIKINTNTIKVLNGEIEKSNIKINEYEKDVKEKRREISKIQSFLIKKEKQLKDFNYQYHKLEANYQLLINLDKQYEGYNKSVKRLMQHIEKNNIKEAINSTFVLGEIIDVPKKYETCIEIALGGAISDVITSNDVVAKKLINILKVHNLGRATFLPLNIIKGNKIRIDNSIKDVPGYIGIASELIGFDNKFLDVAEYVLGRTIVCNDMDSALNVAKGVNYRYKIVTLSGEIVNVGGALTGGSIFQSKSSNIIGRKREIQDLKVKLDNMQEEIASLQRHIETDHDIIKKLDEDCLNIKDTMYYENIEITKFKEKLANMESENLKLNDKVNILKNEMASLKEDLDKNIDNKNQKEENLNNLEQSKKENSESIDIIEKNLNVKQDELENIKDELTSKRIKKAQVDEVVVGKTKEVERLNKEILELVDKKLNIEKQLTNAENNIKNFKENIVNNKNKIENINSDLCNLEKEFKDQEIQTIKIKENIQKEVEKIEELDSIKVQKEEYLHKYDVNLAKLDAEKEALLKKLSEENDMIYDEAKKLKEDIEDLQLYKSYIMKLKSSIAELGIVNVGAIEEYKDIKEKYNFMSTQRDDLIKGKDELMKLIEEMTEKMKIVFNENFNILRGLFNETFMELFNGGSADLILSSGDELSGNIDITVQPPGKKLQNINLMSGGEKVLSAIALLFAILKMKPTPFCILDEIEAALDDANVSRYAQFLKKFSNKVQFIIITHRKGTMEASNVMYGITMEEKGVSKVVSVNLKNNT